jgi:flavin-binding protein dodecin
MRRECAGALLSMTPRRATAESRKDLHREHPFEVQPDFYCLAARARNNERMPDHVYKKIEIVGSSPNGFEEAVHNALARAKKTVRNMRWFEVTETRGFVEDGKIAHWQVTLKVGFTLDE